MHAVLNDSVEISGLANYFPDNSKTFKQLQIDATLELSSEKPDIEHMLRDIINVRIIETFVLETPCSISQEGQILTGRKLIINGEITQKLEYIADNCTQSVHAAEFSTKFSTYIIIDESICNSNTYKVTAYIEHAFIKQLDKRHIFKSIMLILNAVQTNTELLSDIANDSIINCEMDNSLSSYHGCNDKPIPEKLFSQFCCEETIKLPDQKPDIDQIISVIADPEIIAVKFIDTMKGTSLEGQRLTGKMAVLGLEFKQKTLYVADCPDRSIYGVESIFYKSACIVLPPMIEGTNPELLYKNSLLKFKLTIEDLYCSNLGKRRIFKNICMHAEVRAIPTYEICYSSYHNCTESELYLCFADGSCDIQITKSGHRKSIKPCWSPNGSQIAYLSGMQGEYSLFAFNIKNKNHQMLVPYELFENISSFSWLNDNQQIIFSALKDQSKELYLLNTATNKHQQITDGAGLMKSYYPKVSPDGDSVAFLRASINNVDLWCSDIYGKNPRKITDTGSIRDYEWLADSKELVYIDNMNECSCEIYSILLNEYRSVCIFKSDSMYGCKSLAVSPNGRYISFIGTNKDNDDIYVYDIYKDKLQNVTKHYNSIKISSMTWKIDSSKIYYGAKEFMHYDICCVDVKSQHKERLTNTDSSYIQLSYRPKIR